MFEKTFGTFCMRGFLLASLGAIALPVAAQAATELHFDLNAVGLSASPAITGANAATYTGTVSVSTGASFINKIDIDSVLQPSSGSLTNVSGALHLSNGAIASSPASTVTFTIKNTDNTLHTYNATFTELDTNGLFLEGLTNPTTLDSNNFAGVDVSPWAAGPNSGSAIVTDLSGTTTNLDVFIELPEPAIGWIAAAGVGVMGMRRRKT